MTYVYFYPPQRLPLNIMQPASASASDRLHTSTLRDAHRTTQLSLLGLELESSMVQAAVSAVGAISRESHAESGERRLPGEKQIGSVAIWPNDRCCCWAQLFLLVNACTASDASTEPHNTHASERAAEVISSLSWCVCVSWRHSRAHRG